MKTKNPSIDLQQLSELLADAQLAFDYMAAFSESIGGKHLAELIDQHKKNSELARKYIALLQQREGKL